MEAKKVLDEMTERFLTFARSHGGYSEMSRKMGIKPAMFYNFEAGRSKPAIDTLIKVAGLFPDFDLNFVVTGTMRTHGLMMTVEQPAPTGLPMKEADVDLIRLRVENENQKRMIEKLEKENERVWGMVLTKRVQKEMDFLQASSQATVSVDRKRTFTGEINAPDFSKAVPAVIS